MPDESNEDDGSTTMRVTRSQVRELKSRSDDDETLSDVLDRLLKETSTEHTLEEVIKATEDYWGDIACVTVDFPDGYPQGEPAFAVVVVFTGEADSFDDQPGLYDASDKLVLPGEDGEMVLPFGILGTVNGPPEENTGERCMVYRDDSFIGSEYLPLEEGLETLETALTEGVGFSDIEPEP